MRSRPVSSAGHENYGQNLISLNGEGYSIKVYLYAGSVSLEGVDDGHVYLEVGCKENWKKCRQLWTEKRYFQER